MTPRGGRRIHRCRRRFAALEPLDQVREQAPEERVAGVAADAPDFAALVDEHEHRGEALAADESKIGGDGLGDIEPAQWRALALAGLVVGRRDVAIEPLAPDAALLLEHHELGRMRGRREKDEKKEREEAHSRHIASAVAERQQVIERAQLDHQPV